MADRRHQRYRTGRQVPGATPRREHLDLLAFISVAAKLRIDLFSDSWQENLPALGDGTTSRVAQSSLDTTHGLAFKIQTPSTSVFKTENTEQGNKDRFKALIHEVVALESLRSCPQVIDLLGITWEFDAGSDTVWPVILTERSPLGSLAGVLASEGGRILSVTEKLKLCGDVAIACGALHQSGEKSNPQSPNGAEQIYTVREESLTLSTF
jgi:hypothetical protein